MSKPAKKTAAKKTAAKKTAAKKKEPSLVEIENAVIKITLSLSIQWIREGKNHLAVEALEWLGNRFDQEESK